MISSACPATPKPVGVCMHVLNIGTLVFPIVSVTADLAQSCAVTYNPSAK